MYNEFKNKIVKIKKDRLCDGCLDPFKAGSKLRYRSYIFDKEFCSDYLCLDCYEYLMHMSPDEASEGFARGDVGVWRRDA